MRRKQHDSLVCEGCPQAMMDVAARRTMPHVAGLNMLDFDLRQFAANCYMQGVLDATETFLNRGLFSEVSLPTSVEPLEYQI